MVMFLTRIRRIEERNELIGFLLVGMKLGQTDPFLKGLICRSEYTAVLTPFLMSLAL